MGGRDERQDGLKKRQPPPALPWIHEENCASTSDSEKLGCFLVLVISSLTFPGTFFSFV